MLKVKCLVIGVILGLQGAQLKSYVSPDLDLGFKYPSKWQLTTKKGDAKFTIPIKTNTATLEVFRSTFRGTSEEWQAIQDNVNKSLHRTVEKQWQEEILGVPLLLTKIRFQQGAEEIETLTGLLYSARAKKLLFRLTSPAQTFDEAEEAFRSALVTLQTTSGELPKTDDPDVPLPTGTEKPVPVKKPPVVISANAGKGKFRLAAQKVSTKAGGAVVEWRLPQGFRVQPEGLEFVVKHDRLRGQLTVSVNSELDSPKPDAALVAASGESLKQFQAVALREEPAPRVNEAGSTISFVRRKGTTDLGEFVIWQAVGAKASYYWLLNYRGTISDFQKDRSLIEDLLNTMSVEVPK